jgi:hypothetical protein
MIYRITLVIFVCFIIVWIYADHIRAPLIQTTAAITPTVPTPTPLQEGFSEDDAYLKAMSTLGKPNIEKATAVTRNIQFCGSEKTYRVEFSSSLKKLNSGEFLIRFSEKWYDPVAKYEKLNKIDFYIVSADDFQLLYNEGSVSSTLGECKDDLYGLKSFKPLESSVLIAQSDWDAIKGYDAMKLALHDFLKAWAAKNKADLMNLIENPAGFQNLDQILSQQYQYSFTGPLRVLLENDNHEVCAGVDYRVSDSLNKEITTRMSAICQRPNSQNQWKVYMID